MDAPLPKNVQELRSLIGLINYYGKFIFNLTRIVHPLNNLLKITSKWQRAPACNKALQEVKQAHLGHVNY